MIAANLYAGRRRGCALAVEATNLISNGAPRSLTGTITLGRMLKIPDGRCAGPLRPARHRQRPHRGRQRPPRASARIRPRLPQPHRLHHPKPARSRRIQTPPTPSIVKSPFRSIQNLLENPFDLNSSHLVKGYCLGVFKPLLFPGWFGCCAALRPAGGGPSSSPRSRPP